MENKFKRLSNADLAICYQQWEDFMFKSGFCRKGKLRDILDEYADDPKEARTPRLCMSDLLEEIARRWFIVETNKTEPGLSLVCKVGCAHFHSPEFFINGMEADVNDFGEAYDHGRDDTIEDPSEEVRDCRDCGVGCYNMQFDAKPAEEEVLTKYGISKDQYWLICKALKEEFDIGECSMCN